MIPARFKPWPIHLAMVLISIVFLGGCGHTPVTSLYKLSKIKPQTTNLEELRVAVHIPKAFEVAKKGVVLTLSLEEVVSEPSFNEQFRLQLMPSHSHRKLIKTYGDRFRHFLIFRLARTDIPRFENFRKIQLGGVGMKKRKGSITIAAHVCRNLPTLPPSIIISTFLKTSETKEFVTLISNADILDEVESIEADDIAPEC